MANSAISNRVSDGQLDQLLEFLSEHSHIAKGIGLGARSKQKIDKLWDSLALKLNSHGYGSSKSGERWKKYWADIKHKCKVRLANRKRNAYGTNGDSSTQDELSDVDKKILSIIGERAVFGRREYQNPVISNLQKATLEHITLKTATSEKETIEHEILEQETIEHEILEQETSEQEPIERLTLEQDTIEQGTSHEVPDDVHVIIIPATEPHCYSPSTGGQTSNLSKSHNPETGSLYIKKDLHKEQPLSDTPVADPGLARPKKCICINKSKPKVVHRIKPEWINKLEGQTINAETKLAEALVIAESARIQAETAKVQAETMRSLVDLVQRQHEDIHALIEMIKKD